MRAETLFQSCHKFPSNIPPRNTKFETKLGISYPQIPPLATRHWRNKEWTRHMYYGASTSTTNLNIAIILLISEVIRDH